MATETEQILEEKLLSRLEGLGYERVDIPTEKELLSNLKTQLEKHNKIQLSDSEFDKILNILNKGTVFEKAKTLRERQHIIRDNGDNLYFDFLDSVNWCKNEFQVTHQITIKGRFTNRYDVTILINGLPLCQIELKRKGVELKQAFDQINRYQRHSYAYNSALFQYVQLFVISNGVNTKYLANNVKQSFKQTFYWTDEHNERKTNLLNGFSEEFLTPCHLSKMISKYIVLHESSRILMVLRPYQYYAVEAIINHVENNRGNGYIWHTTGSGKTLTSFKTSQILTHSPDIKKVVFVVDRNDLDYQTTKEFNYFSEGSVDGTDNTRQLVKQFADDTKIIVTTIQKLNNAISRARYTKAMEKMKDERMVFIFDECHRSQFGDTHKRITEFFSNIQLFGFTGTPIFAENAHKNDHGKRTTRDLFGECLHKYLITDAIRDDNVLKFAVEYVGRFKQKPDSNTNIDIDVEDIDTREVMESDMRIEKIVDYIIKYHDSKTHNREFSAIMAVSGREMLYKYYDLFKQKREEGLHDLNIATIFSYGANEATGATTDGAAVFDWDADLAAEEEIRYLEQNHQLGADKLESYMQDYNEMFNSKYSLTADNFYTYYNDISQKLKNREKEPENLNHRIDILLVVNMFLTGFDAKKVNSLYVDKNLKYHGLIQAYSRTNRIYNDKKSQGNIVVFRNLKHETDQAITLFSNKDALETVIMKPYEEYVDMFKEQLEELYNIVEDVDAVNSLYTEEEELEFVKAFRALMRLQNVLKTFSDFEWEHVGMEHQEFVNFQAKYLDLRDRTVSEKHKDSILNDIDFEVELIHSDVINVTYIVQLLVKLKSESQHKKAASKSTEEAIFNLLNTESNLRNKRELIEKFITENLPFIVNEDEVEEEFDKFWRKEQDLAFDKIVSEEQLSPEKTQEVIGSYIFDEKEPLRDELLALIIGQKPKLLERRERSETILSRITSYIDTFISGFGGRM